MKRMNVFMLAAAPQPATSLVLDVLPPAPPVTCELRAPTLTMSCVTKPWLHVAVTWALGLSCKHTAKAAPRFSAGNKAEAAAWTSHFLQGE